MVSPTMVVIATSALVASCGGSSFKAAAPKSTTTTTVESAETRAWVTAAARGVRNTPDMKVSASDAECLGRALVETVTVARLKAAGVTPASLADPNADLPPRLGASMPQATREALGAALQACGSGIFSTAIAQGIADEVGHGYVLDAASRTCVDHWFALPEHGLLIASAVLNSQPTKADSTQLADLIVTCLDVATLLSPSMHMTFDNNERTCINEIARTSAPLRSALEAEISGSANTSTTHLEELFGASIVRCLTSQHLQQLGSANSG